MKITYSIMQHFLTAAVLTAAVMAASVPVGAADADLAPLPLKLPMPTLKGTPEDLPKGPSVEPLSDKPRPAFMAPKGIKNVALNKKVTGSDRNPITGDLSQITDGSKEGMGLVELTVAGAPEWLRPGGWLMIEVSPDHARPPPPPT